MGGAAVALTLPAYGAWVAASFGLVRFAGRVDNVRLIDFVRPWRWSDSRGARGHHWVTAARRCLEQRRLADAIKYAVTGLELAPAHRDGRLLLAEMYFLARLPELGRQTLVEGLRYHRDDPVFLQPLLRYLLQHHEDHFVVGLARRALGRGGTHGEAARLLGLAAATASCLRGAYDQAEDFLRQVPRLAESPEGRLLAARMECERGYHELALGQLRRLAAERPHDAEIQRELLAQLRRRGRDDEARRASLVFQLAHPDLPGPRIDLLHAYRDAGDAARVGSEVEAILREFPADSGALLQLADFAASRGDVTLARRVVQHAAGRGLPLEPYLVLAVEAGIVARDYRGALDAIRELTAGASEWSGRHRSLCDSLQAIAHQGLGDPSNARIFLRAFLGAADLRSDNLLAVAARFSALNADDYARQALARAVDVDPLNQAALMRLIELDLTLERIDDLPAHVRRFVTMHRPSPELLRVVQQKLGSDLFLFSADAAAALEAVGTVLERQRKSAAW